MPSETPVSLPPLLRAGDYFGVLPTIEPFAGLLGAEHLPWQPLLELRNVILGFIAEQRRLALAESDSAAFGLQAQSGGGYLSTKTICLPEPFCMPEQNIYLEHSVLLEPNVLIKPMSVVLGHCELRHGAYLRGGVLIDEHCVIGHTTELKNTIFLRHSEAGHFTYAGDSIVGAYVNIGAGTKLCNLAFRSLAAKQNGQFPPLSLEYGGKTIDYQPEKMGCILGDGCETGCNSVIGPFALLGKETQVLPSCYVPSGVYHPKVRFYSSADRQQHKI